MALNNITLKVVQHGKFLTDHKFSLAFGTHGVEALGNKYGCPIDAITAYQTLEASLDETDEGSVLSSLIDPIKDLDAQSIFLSAGFSVESSILTIWVRIPPTVPMRTPMQLTPCPVSIITPQATIAAPHSICKAPASGSSKKQRLPGYAIAAIRSMVDRVVPRDKCSGVMLRGQRQADLVGIVDTRPAWVVEVLYSLFDIHPMTSGGDLQELMQAALRCVALCKMPAPYVPTWTYPRTYMF